MTIDAETISLASRGLMIVGFGLALLATAVKRRWVVSALLFAALVESYNRVRYAFHGWVREALLGVHDAPGAKDVMQSTLLYVSAAAGCLAVVLAAPYLARASHGQRIMIAGLIVVAATLGLELISPHRIDAVIYHPEGPFARSAIAYFVGAMAIAGGALMTPRRR